MKLLSCTCGGKATTNEYPELPVVYCTKCGKEAGPHALRREAAREWNQVNKQEVNLCQSPM